jgi:hypothetical protein
MEMSGQFHALDALPRGKNPLYPLYRRLEGPQNRSGLCGEDKNLHRRESNLGCPPGSPSLYRLLFFADKKKIKRRMKGRIQFLKEHEYVLPYLLDTAKTCVHILQRHLCQI